MARFFFSVWLVLLTWFGVSAQNRYNALIYEGNKQFEKGNYERSSSKFFEASEMNQEDFTAHYNLGNAFYKRKMYEEAKAEYAKAETLARNKADKAAALYNQGNAFMQTNDSERAADLYRKALKVDPYNESIRKNYEIARLKEKEKSSERNSQDDSEEKDEGKEQKQGKSSSDESEGQKQQGGEKRRDQGEGEGDESDENTPENKTKNKMPKALEDALMERVEEKEKETARKILNRNAYILPQSKEKDW
ncbi:tetratricopeptide repeat protein [Bergeyella sp. RCAD1439]|uniref:tetratricopeptide repeat protein n=1 Tax=Bergeyella anatis TaxID=3113737 RepID=UPI002E16EF1B|nr:tetratricopeptide repeat protein [Bergeyella sp. RCAD1439]